MELGFPRYSHTFAHELPMTENGATVSMCVHAYSHTHFQLADRNYQSPSAQLYDTPGASASSSSSVVEDDDYAWLS
jgi:hypothetical protein